VRSAHGGLTPQVRAAGVARTAEAVTTARVHIAVAAALAAEVERNCADGAVQISRCPSRPLLMPERRERVLACQQLGEEAVWLPGVPSPQIHALAQTPPDTACPERRPHGPTLIPQLNFDREHRISPSSPAGERTQRQDQGVLTHQRHSNDRTLPTGLLAPPPRL
jgi:hypothetical protein